jgi:hypothetical protein
MLQQLSIEEIRKELDRAESLYSQWMDQGQYDRACLAHRAIDKLQDLLFQRIQEQDPHTTEADIRFFESQEG